MLVLWARYWTQSQLFLSLLNIVFVLDACHGGKSESFFVDVGDVISLYEDGGFGLVEFPSHSPHVLIVVLLHRRGTGRHHFIAQHLETDKQVRISLASNMFIICYHHTLLEVWASGHST